MEPNGERLKVAHEKYSAVNIEYVQGHAEDTRHISPIKCYDSVFSNAAIQWCKNKDQVFKGVYEILKKGGKFAFTANTYYVQDEVLYTPDIVSVEYRAAMKKLFLPDEYKFLATSNNFEIV